MPVNQNGKGKEALFPIPHMHDSGKRLTILTIKEIQALYLSLKDRFIF